MSSSNESETTPAARPAGGGTPTWLLSLAGVALVLALLVAVNVIVRKAVPLKADLTEDKLHTLSDGTKEILKGLDTKVSVAFFASTDKDNVPPGLSIYRRKVDALLSSFERTAKGGKLVVERLDPEPDSVEEERARTNDLRAIPGRFEEPVYFGIAVTCLDRKSTIPLLLPDREGMLEYDLARAIVEVTRASTPKVGVMSALPVAGTPSMPFGPQQQGPRQWFFHRSLTRDFDPDPNEAGSNLVDLGMNFEEVPEDIDVVVLIHPAGISEATEFALDQFLLRGGRIVAYLDAYSFYAEISNPQQPQFGGRPQPPGTPVSSDLKKLLPSWGVNFESGQVLADLGFQSIDITNGQPSATALQVTRDGVDGEDPLLRDVRQLLFYKSGVFYVDKKDGIVAETLVSSTGRSQLVDPDTARRQPGQVIRDFDQSDKEYPLVVRLSGKFTTAFPDGKPEADDAPGGEGEDEDGKAADGDEAAALTESAKESSVLLVADSDMLVDFFALVMDRRGQVRGYANHNLPFALGAVEQAAGGADLTSIRSRGSTARPFSKFKELEAEASKKYNEELSKLDAKLADINRDLSELIQTAAAEQEGSAVIEVELTPEMQAKQNQFRQQQKGVEKRRSELNRELRKEVRGIENKIKNWNIIGIPLIVIAIGVVHLIVRRIKVSAR